VWSHNGDRDEDLSPPPRYIGEVVSRNSRYVTGFYM